MYHSIQMEVGNASPAIAAQQGTDTQVGAPKEGADTTGVVLKEEVPTSSALLTTSSAS